MHLYRTTKSRKNVTATCCFLICIHESFLFSRLAKWRHNCQISCYNGSTKMSFTSSLGGTFENCTFMMEASWVKCLALKPVNLLTRSDGERVLCNKLPILLYSSNIHEFMSNLGWKRGHQSAQTSNLCLPCSISMLDFTVTNPVWHVWLCNANKFVKIKISRKQAAKIVQWHYSWKPNKL